MQGGDVYFSVCQSVSHSVSLSISRCFLGFHGQTPLRHVSSQSRQETPSFCLPFFRSPPRSLSSPSVSLSRSAVGLSSLVAASFLLAICLGLSRRSDGPASFLFLACYRKAG